MNNKTPVNILLVDDQPGKLLSYETILGELGENLIKVNSGKKALECLLKHDVAVVLVDVCMPELDGFELASMIRNHPRFQKTAIILVSGILVEDVDRLKGYVSGAVDYVAVPIVPEILRAKVQVFAELFRKTTQLEQLNRDLEQRVQERTAEINASAELLRESEERYRLLVENVRDYAIYLLDPDGIVSNWNSGAESLKGYKEQEIVGRPFAQFVPPEDRQSGVPVALLKTAAAGGHSEREGWHVRSNGTRYWCSGHITALRNPEGKLLGFAVISRDLSDRKRAEEERGDLLRKAEAARREAERANRLKDEFLATLSHELRTPLNAITGWGHMLQAGELDRATQVKAVETINRNAQLQARLISDLLDVSRIVSGNLRLDVKSMDLAKVVEGAIDSLRPAAEAKMIQIDAARISKVKPMRGDPARLQQVVWNLLSNAIKFTPVGGHVQVRLDGFDTHVELTVEDNGVGIQPDFLPHIFEPFRQANSSNARVHHGLGLGLAIVRRLMEMHGGYVLASNRPNRSGASFKAVLPVSAYLAAGYNGAAEMDYPSPASAAPAPAAPSLGGLTVLVVDDESDAREVVAMNLKQSGAKVTEAKSAKEALAILGKQRPDVIVADVAMPEQDGYWLIRKIRNLSSQRTRRTPAVALTAYAGSQDRAKILSAGFDRHVAKPIYPPQLVAAIAAVAKPRATDKSIVKSHKAQTRA